MTRVAIAVLLFACSGCGDPAPGDAGPALDGASGPSVTLGEGTSTFVALDDGAEVELVAGPQGGWHLFVTARLRGVDLDGVTLRYTATPPGATSPLGRTELVLDETDFVAEADRVVRAGDFVILEIDTPADVVGLELEMTVEVAAPDGARASDRVRVRVIDEVQETGGG